MKRIDPYFRHEHFHHAGTACSTSLLSDRWLWVNVKAKRYRSHRHHFPPLFHAYLPPPWISEANRIRLRVSSELSRSPATFRTLPAKFSPRSPLPALSAQAEALRPVQVNSRNWHTRLPVSQLLFPVRHVRRTRLSIAPAAFRHRRCSARCCPWLKPMKLLWAVEGARRHRP